MNDILTYLLILQALFLSAWLYSQRSQPPLAAWLLLLALHMGANLLEKKGLWGGLTPALVLLHGPLMWAWVRHRALAAPLGLRAAAPHALPALAGLLAGWLAPEFHLAPFAALQFSLYWVASFKLLQLHRRQLGQLRSQLAADLGWLRGLLLILCLIAALSFARLPLRQWDVAWAMQLYQIVLLALLACLYGLLWQGLRSPQRWAALRAEELEVLAQKGPLADDHADLWSQRMARWEADRPYLDPELSLTGLAEEWGDSARLLSQMIQKYSGASNFRDFVNRARIQWACREIERGRDDKLLTLSLDAGFNSKSVFNEAFKRHLGASPSAYRAQIRTRAQEQSRPES